MSANKQNKTFEIDSIAKAVSLPRRSRYQHAGRPTCDPRFDLFCLDGTQSHPFPKADSIRESERYTGESYVPDGYWYFGQWERLFEAVLDNEFSWNVTREENGLWIPGRTYRLLVRSRQWVSVLSSRIGRMLEEHERWFDALRTLGVQLRSQPGLLLTADGTTVDPFIRRLGQLFEIPVVKLAPMSVEGDERPPIGTASKDGEAEVEPTIFYQAKEVGKSADRLLASLASLTLVLAARSNGNVLAAARSRLSISDRAKCEQQRSTRLLIDRSLTKKCVQDELLDAGAVGWWLHDTGASQGTEARSTELKEHCISSSDQSGVVSELTYDEVARLPFLIHWTRRCNGPWPGQSESSWIDDLIFKTQGRNHDVLSTLCRILASQRLIATNRLTRAVEKVVCFSETTFEAFVKRRVFRAHLNRWDFEPYGVAFDPLWLAEQGCRRVIYGEEKDWERLDVDDQVFFQLKKTRSKKRDSEIDWTVEREWRLVGDLDLSIVPREAALVFVRDRADVAKVSPLTDWPIVVLS